MNPNSKLWLCKTNLENDYNNTLTFATKNTQRNYFIGNPEDPTSYGVSTKAYTDFTYLRIENAIKVDDFIENIDTNNYAVILNNNKYYYYFITSMDYIDETTTKINIELDVMQTYFFDITYKNTFVEREHVSDDTVGKHTLPEGLETGEYIGGIELPVDPASTLQEYIIFQVIIETEPNPNDPWECVPTVYGGVFSGTEFRVFDKNNAGRFIKYMDDIGQRDYIVNIFMYNGEIDLGNSYSIVYQGSVVCDYTVVDTSIGAKKNYMTIMQNKPSTLGSYTPRNNKLLCWPYHYLLISNNAGLTKSYNYEDFTSTGIQFEKISTITVGGSVVYNPMNYKYDGTGYSINNETEGFVGAKFPLCSWSSDGYTNWLTQKSVDDKYRAKSRVTQALTSTGTTALGLATGNPLLIAMGASGMAETGANIINDIQNDMKQKEEHQIAPMELEGYANAGDVMFSEHRCKPLYKDMYIKEEYAKIIDKYFDMFGYQVNELKTPNIKSRRYWNYIKTRACNFTGDIPQEYMSRIKGIFNKGITFWHDPSKMFDYSQSNTIVSNS